MIEVRISYDYELFWGVWDKVTPAYIAANVRNANPAVRGLLKLHKEHSICCTFAIVGAMLGKDRSPVDVMHSTERNPLEIEKFENASLEFLTEPDLFQAPDDILDALNSDPLFEIGSHTLTHVYALDVENIALDTDFQIMNAAFLERFGFSPKALVMPKNQTTEAAFKMAQSYGFESIRVNPDILLYRPIPWTGLMAKIVRGLRFLDAFFPLLELCSGRKFREVENNGLRKHVGQYFFRPYFPSKALFKLHFLRMRLALHLARIRNHQVHYWMHPHNFGRNPEEALSNYGQFLAWLKKLEDRGTVKILRMSE